MACTEFCDMCSGGEPKLDWEKIYIELPQEQAEKIFKALFKRNPNNVTCHCCGEDFSVSESEDIHYATAYQRKCEYSYKTKNYDLSTAEITVDEYVAGDVVLYIPADKIPESLVYGVRK